MAKLIIANWKLNPRTEREAVNLARSSDFKNVVIAPPFIFLAAVRRAIRKAALGAQDMFWENFGPYTGEVSAVQLKSLGVKYVIIGHSERRHWLQETDEMVNKKVKTALKAGLKVVLCVGEPKRELRIKNYELRKAKNYVKRQVLKDLKGIHNSQFKIHNSLIIAYEPVWAIGTGRSDKPQHTVEMVKFIKTFLNSKFKIQNSKVLYGGSVTSKNAAGFLNRKEIDGVLVGGASLKPKEFQKILFYVPF